MQQPILYREKSNIDQWQRTGAYGVDQGCCCFLQIFVGTIALALLVAAVAIPLVISLKSSSIDTGLTPTTSTVITMSTSSGSGAVSTTTITVVTSSGIWTNATANSTNAVTTSITSALMSTMSSCFGPMVLTFDDIINASNIQGAVPSLYNCFNWVNGWYLNVSVTAATSGYRRALTSGEYIVLNRNGTLMSMTTTTTSFDIYSFVGSSGYASPLHLSLQGLRSAGVVAYNRDVLVYNNTDSIISLNWSNLTTVTVGSYYHDSVNYQNYTGLGYQFSLDNLNVTLN